MSENSKYDWILPIFSRWCCPQGLGIDCTSARAALMAQTVKNLPSLQETRVLSLGQEDLLRRQWLPTAVYSCLENFMDRGAWWATVRGVAKSQTQMTFSIFTVVQVPSRLHLLYQEERQNTATFKVDNQQGPTVNRIELCSALCGDLNRRGVWKGMDTCICITEFLHHSPETLTLFVHQLYPNTK